MLNIFLAGLVAAGTCVTDEALSDAEHGDFVTCHLVSMPTVVTMLQEHNPTWQVTLLNPQRCQQPLNITYQLISRSDGLIELIERLEKMGSITAKIDSENQRVSVTCKY